MLFALSGYAQLEPFLLLEKPGKIKSRIRFYVGDEIKWSFIDEKTFNTGVIKMISDSSFTTGQGVSVRIDEMDAIALEKGGTVKNIGKGAFYAIPPMILFSAANNAFNTGRSPLVDEEVWWISGIFLGITGISYLIPDEKKRNLESKWRIIPIIH
jgi:hypothetical protein